MAVNYRGKKFYNNGPWYYFHKTSFSWWIKMKHNKLECYITSGWKGLQGTNALAYSAHSKVTKKMKFSEYNPWGHILSTSFSSYLTNGPNKL
jgi:hypothetical protein